MTAAELLLDRTFCSSIHVLAEKGTEKCQLMSGLAVPEPLLPCLSAKKLEQYKFEIYGILTPCACIDS